MWTVCQWFGRIAFMLSSSVPCASDLAELPVSGQCASGLAELPLCGQCDSDLAELPVCRGVSHVPVIWQELPVPMFGRIACMWTLLC